MSTVTGFLIVSLLLGIPVETHELRVAEVTPVFGQAVPGLMVGDVKSDSDGNAYYQVFEGNLQAPVVKISRDGRRATRFDIRYIQRFRAAQVLDYFVTFDGDVAFLLALRNPEMLSPDVFVAFFDPEGAFRTSIRLNIGNAQPRRLAVFRNGQFLLSGWRGLPGRGRPLLLVLDARGEAVQEVRTNEDVTLKRFASADSNDPVKRQQIRDAEREYESAVELTTTALASDGNVYVARRSSRGPILAITPGGEVERVIQLAPPEPGAELIDIKVGGGRIAAMFGVRVTAPRTAGMPKVVMAILDATTGEVLRKFTYSDPRIGLAFVSYSPERFTFLGNDGKGHLQFITAE
jgi:hypothetical protein